MSTKKNFIATAELLNSARRNYQLTGTQAADIAATVCDRLAHEFADLYEKENARFDRGRFLSACGVK
jgi:hypothetical protein